MFNYYDANEDQSLNYAELLDVSEKDHLSKLSQLCKLTDILEFHDLDENKGIDMQEFYTAFGKRVKWEIIHIPDTHLLDVITEIFLYNKILFENKFELKI